MRFTLLEPLRGIAALWVFLFHLPLPAEVSENWPRLVRLFRAGDLGVPMFFVISGYCITASARTTIVRNKSTKSFLHRRMRRIYPPFWASILIVAMIPFVIEGLSSLKTGNYVPPDPTHRNLGYLNYSASDWILVASLAQVFQPVGDPNGGLHERFTSINAVYWTLAIEVQFYLLVTAALLVRRRFYVILLLISLASLALWAAAIGANSGFCLPFWPMFAGGALLYWVLEKGWTLRRFGGVNAQRIAGLMAFVLAVMASLVIAAGYSFSHFAFAAFFVALLYLLYGVDSEFERRCLSTENLALRIAFGAMMALGAMSYSLYLLHGRLQALSMQVVRQVLPANSIIYTSFVVLLTAGACYVFFLICEQPFTTGRREKQVETPSIEISSSGSS